MLKFRHRACFGGGAATRSSNNLTKFGFTLAEVLITLGIVGVVAAMTIPNLMAKIQEKQTVTKLRATQSILSQALKAAEDEVGDPSCWGLALDKSESDAKIIAQKLKPYLKIAVDCGTDDRSGKCVKNAMYKRLNGGNHVNYAANGVYYRVKLLNGASIWWRSSNDNRYIVFFVDTNGTLPPNIWGRDLFSFEYIIDKGLKPQGAPDEANPYTTHCINTNSDGYGCAFYVLQTGKMDYLK